MIELLLLQILYSQKFQYKASSCPNEDDEDDESDESNDDEDATCDCDWEGEWI